MSYEANCPCGAILQVGDHAAGKRIKCPRCGELISISPREIEEEEIPVVSLGNAESIEANASGERTPCPYCAENVLVTAKICPCCQSPLGPGPENTCMSCGSVNSAMITECRNCGKNMIPGMGEPPPSSEIPARPQRFTMVATNQDSLSFLDWIIALIFPIGGLIMGIIYFTSGRNSRGWHILGLALIGFALRYGCSMSGNSLFS